MAEFRLLHASDLHVATRYGIRNPSEHAQRLAAGSIIAAVRGGVDVFSVPSLTLGEIFPGVADAFYPSTFLCDRLIQFAHYVEDHAPEIDLVVLSGDVSTTGQAEDLQCVRDALRGLMPKSWHPIGTPPAVLSSSTSVVIMPGNHDRFSGHYNEPGGTEFEVHFGSQWDAGQGLMNGLSNRVKSSVFGKSGEHLAIVCADFSLRSPDDATPGRLNYLSQGKVYKDTLEDLLLATREVQNENESCSVIWAIHFPPEFPAQHERMSLIDANTVCDAAARHGVNMILAGHYHDQRSYEAPSAPGVRVFAAGTPCSIEIDRTHSFFDIRVTTDGSSITAIEATTTSFDDRLDVFCQMTRERIAGHPPIKRPG